MQALVMKGYKVDALDGDGRTPLMHWYEILYTHIILILQFICVCVFHSILPDGGAQVHCVDFLIRNGANLDHQVYITSYAHVHPYYPCPVTLPLLISGDTLHERGG